MARYSKDHWDKTHDAIVDAAAAILRERGFDETSVGEVMKAVGLTHGGFYAHFEDKTAMLVAAIERAFVASPKKFTVMSGRANAKSDPSMVARMYLSDGQLADVANGCPGAALMSEMARQPEPLRQAFEVGARKTVTALAQTEGLTDEKANVWAALAMLMGALSLMRAVPNDKTRDMIRSQTIAAFKMLAQTPTVS